MWIVLLLRNPALEKELVDKQPALSISRDTLTKEEKKQKEAFRKKTYNPDTPSGKAKCSSKWTLSNTSE